MIGSKSRWNGSQNTIRSFESQFGTSHRKFSYDLKNDPNDKRSKTWPSQLNEALSSPRPWAKSQPRTQTSLRTDTATCCKIPATVQSCNLCCFRDYRPLGREPPTRDSYQHPKEWFEPWLRALGQPQSASHHNSTEGSNRKPTCMRV